MHTDAAHRFERGVERAVAALRDRARDAAGQQIMGGRAGPITGSHEPAVPAGAGAVNLRRARLARLLGMEGRRRRSRAHPACAGMSCRRAAMAGRSCRRRAASTSPSKEDLVEEIARIHGYERIPVAVPAGAVPLACARAKRAWPESICAAS
jgi:phenylalanyl-tRNA synthetase beta chain